MTARFSSSPGPMPIPLKPPAWQKAIGHQSTRSPFQRHAWGSPDPGSRQQGLALGFWHTCPLWPRGCVSKKQSREDGPAAAGGWRAGQPVPIGQSPHMQQTYSAVGRRHPLCLYPHSAWPHLLPIEPPGSMGLCISSPPTHPET